MKLINLNFTKKNLTFFLIILTFSSLLSSTSNTSLKIKSRNNNNNISNKYKSKLSNNITTKEPPFSNPFGNLLAGIGQKLADGLKQFLDCFSKKDLTGKKTGKKNSGVINFFMDIFAKITIPLQYLLKIGGPVIRILCKFRLVIVKIVQKLFLQKKLKKLKLRMNSELERTGTISKRLRIRYRNKWNLFKAAFNSVKSVATKSFNFVKSAATKVYNVGKGAIMWTINKIFMPWFRPIKNKIFKIIDNIKKMLFGGFLAKVVDCGKKFMGKAFEDLKNVFKGLKTKFSDLKNASLMGYPMTIMYIIDLIFSLLCEKNIFQGAVDNIANASKTKDTNQKTFMIGKGLGTIVRLMANVKSNVSPLIIKLPIR